MMARRTVDPDQIVLFTIEELTPPSGPAVTDRAAELAAWQEKFERADWIAPYDTAGGMKKGESKPGWRCPDPDCAQIEPNSFLLSINHGWDPESPGWEPYDGHCHLLRLLASHAVYDARVAQVLELAAEGLDDEQIAVRVGFWDSASIAQTRKSAAKAARR